VRSLILFAPANPYSHVADWLVRAYNTPLGRLFVWTAPYLPRRLQLAGLGRMYGDPARIADGCLQDYVDGLRVPGTMRHILTIVRDWFVDMGKLEMALPRVVGVPTLLVWGDRDRAVDPASAAELQRVLPQAQLLVIQGAGHVAFEEMPEEANQIMLEWLRRDQRPAASSAKRGGSATVA
jgi:4,5:9,10-diseco-3-hydroxy-5,9,17-trioxoandrosta-1(10),2-diene-4-oate hydrolase